MEKISEFFNSAAKLVDVTYPGADESQRLRAALELTAMMQADLQAERLSRPAATQEKQS